MSVLVRFIAGKEFRAVANGFAQVLMAAPEAAGTTAREPISASEPAIEVEFAGKVRVRIPGSVSAELATAVIKALSRR